MPEEKKESSLKGKVSLLTIFDNYVLNPRLEKGWGFSCLIRYPLEEGEDRKILFDTGDNGKVLSANAEQLGMDFQDIDFVFISHLHHDHTGGLSAVLERNQDVTLYKPESFSGPSQIEPGIFTTGPLGNWTKEQSLVLETSKGLVVVTGCAHPGIVKIVEKSKEMVKDTPVYLVIGGFHLSSAPEEKIKEIISDFKGMKVQKAAPCHCSGDRCRELFQEAYGEDFISNGVGKEIQI